MDKALILIDVQNDYFKGGRFELNHPEETALNAKKALDFFRNKALPVFHVQHINTREDAFFFISGTEGIHINAMVAPLPGEKIIIKNTPDSFFNTDLLLRLKELEIKQLVICGMMSHMCVDTTVRSAKGLGYEIELLSDACTTRDLVWENASIPAAVVHAAFMAALHIAFAAVKTTADFIKSDS
ncbi:cysteine hydrolase family protein [Acetobacterium bakii]|uniref:Isochorismatase n=1 Tax=Acetobacterium bakii TaxID=52689 RepID=A0A0L6TYQ0_9FIRM|nr:cysteine hydrolase family protein [Acetobacterium bakii]KNZ40710.1 isochorismatase [Acetobacterium bakii]